MNKAIKILKTANYGCDSNVQLLSLGEEVTNNDIREAIAELEKPKNCHNCAWITPIDRYCKHPQTESKHVAEYILFSGCGLHTESADD